MTVALRQDSPPPEVDGPLEWASIGIDVFSPIVYKPSEPSQTGTYLDPLEVIVLAFGSEDRGVAKPVPDVIQSVVLLGTEHPPGDAVAECMRRDDVG